MPDPGNPCVCTVCVVDTLTTVGLAACAIGANDSGTWTPGRAEAGAGGATTGVGGGSAFDRLKYRSGFGNASAQAAANPSANVTRKTVEMKVRLRCICLSLFWMRSLKCWNTEPDEKALPPQCPDAIMFATVKKSSVSPTSAPLLKYQPSSPGYARLGRATFVACPAWTSTMTMLGLKGNDVS